MMCAYGAPEDRPEHVPLCAKGRQKRGLPLGDSEGSLREGERKKR